MTRDSRLKIVVKKLSSEASSEDTSEDMIPSSHLYVGGIVSGVIAGGSSHSQICYQSSLSGVCPLWTMEYLYLHDFE